MIHQQTHVGKALLLEMTCNSVHDMRIIDCLHDITSVKTVMLLVHQCAQASHCAQAIHEPQVTAALLSIMTVAMRRLKHATKRH